MNTTNYKQYDTRWAKLPYKDNPDNIGNNGCGEVAVCNSIIEMVSQMNQTPKTMQPYCRQFACHDGTYWSGIPTMLKHYGCTEVMEHQNMASLWKELAKGDRVAVYMMNSRPGGSKGIHWTSGGHFVCSVAYKKENGLHKVYVKDSNSKSKDRNGWISYEENMRGDVSACWSGKLNGSPAPTPTPTPTGKLVVDGVGGYETVKRLQEFLKLKDPDGLIGRQRKANAKWYPSLTAVSFATSGGSNTVTALQKWLGLSDPDGLLGKNTTGALQKRLRDYGYLAKNESIDSIFGTKSMKALQTALNNDFKKKSDPTPPAPTPTKDTKVIDVSSFQKSIDFAKAKADGVQGVIVKCGFRHGEGGALDEDSDYMKYIKGAYNAGLPVGIYFFTEAINAKEGKEEAQYTIKLWQKAGIPISYPIGIDTEEVFWTNPDGTKGKGRANSDKLSKAKRTEAIKAFCEEIKAQGYTPMIYASLSWFDDCLDMSKLPYDVWCAQYYKECQYKGKVALWQYTSEGKVKGISGVVDINRCYIEPKKVNPPAPSPAPKKSVQDKMCSWAKKIADSGDYKYKRWKSGDVKTQQCPICKKLTGQYKGWNCIGFAWASWHHGGGLDSKCDCGVISNDTAEKMLSAKTDADALKIAQKYIGLKDIKVIRNKSGIAASSLKKGDVVLYFKGSTYFHTVLYVGNDKVAESNSGHNPNITYGKVSYHKEYGKVAIRYTGK